MPVGKEIGFSKHAMDQILDRGTSMEEVKTAIRDVYVFFIGEKK